MAKRAEPVDKIEGYLEVGLNELDEIVINIPPLKKRREQHKLNCAYRGNTEELCNCGIEYERIVLSPAQARHLSDLLLKNVEDAEANRRIRRRIAIRGARRSEER